MEVGDSPASLSLLADDSVLGGDVVDLSLTGCLMRLSRLGAVRFNAQAEVSFHMQGLPFRLAGITREMHDKRTLEIQFSQMSKRSRDDLNQVITELIEKSNREKKTP
jgi:c-di-GMP-binding flagellar brake protein YcgR